MAKSMLHTMCSACSLAQNTAMKLNGESSSLDGVYFNSCILLYKVQLSFSSYGSFGNFERF